MAEYTVTELDYVAAMKVRGLLSAAKKWLKKNPPPDDWPCGRYAYAYAEMPVFPWTRRDACIDRPRGNREPVESPATGEVTQ